MKKNIIIYISNDSNEYDVYRFFSNDLSEARHFLDCSVHQLTPIVNRVHAKIVDEITGICTDDFRMDSFDTSAHINHKNTPVDIVTLRK